MQLTTRRKIPYPDLSGDDTPVDLPQLFHDRAVILDKGVDVDSGTLGARPVSTAGSPGIAGRQFIVTDQADSPRLDLDIGVGWVTVGPAPVDGAANIPSLRTLGTGHQQAVAGDDARLIGGGNASGDLTGVYPGPMTVATWNGQSKAAVVGGNPPQTHGSSHRPAGTDPVTNLTDASIAAANIDGAAGTPSMRTLGGGGQQAMAGNATPTPGPHAAQHKYAGSDPLVSLTPTLKNANYVAAVGDLVIMSGSNNTITLPNAPSVDGAQCAVLAVTAAVTVNRAGTDTITTTSQGQLTISVAQGTSVVFTYHSGVWYGLVSGSGGGATGLVPLSPPSRAYRNAAWPIPNNAVTKVPIDTKAYDPIGAFDVTTNNRYAVQTAGYYAVESTIEFALGSAAQRAYLSVFKNGAEVLRGTDQVYRQTAGDGVTVSVEDVIQCNAGDYLEIFMYLGPSANGTLSAVGALSNYFTVAQVAQVGSPPAGQGMGVVARAYSSGNFTVTTSATKVPINTLSFDPGSSFSTGNNRFVCPATGYYKVEGQVAVTGAAAGNNLASMLYKNGVQVTTNTGQASATGGLYSEVSDILFCQAGDYIELWQNGNTSGTGFGGASFTYLSVVQVAGAATFGALSPTAQSAPYTAGAGQLVLMTGANAVTLPTGPVPGSQVEVMALTAQVPVNRGGTDTINNAGVAGQQSVTVNAGQAIIFSYLGGVWYASPVGGGQSLPPSARAYASTAQVFGSGAAAAKLLIDTKAFDPGGNFDITNHRYVAPVAGFYHVDVNTLFTVSATGTYTQLYVQIQKNGATQAETGSDFATASFMGATISDVIQMNAGDYLEVWCQSIGQAATVDPSYVLNYMSVHPIGVIGAPTPGQGQATVARAYRNAAFSPGNAWNVVPMDTVVYDPGNNFKTNNYTYTCPVTGYYQVNANITATTNAVGQEIGVAIYHNSGLAASSLVSGPASGSLLSPSVSDIVYCQAGDTISLGSGVAGGTPPALSTGSSNNYLSVQQVAGTNLIGALSPTAQSAPYAAGAGQQVLMTGSNPVTLPNAPMAGSNVEVVALSGNVVVSRAGADTITQFLATGLTNLTVNAGESLTFTYLNGVWYAHRKTSVSVITPSNSGIAQNGVINAGDAAVSAVTVTGGTGAINFTIAAAVPLWIKSTGGAILPVNLAGVTTTLALPTSPASARYAVYGLEMDTAGVLSLVKGADSATVLNTPALVASNTPVTTAGKVRIWDFAVFNNAGAFSLSGQIDRRPWSRGASVSPTWSVSANNTGAYAQVSSGAVRLECSGVPMKFQMGPLVFQETSAPNIVWNYALVIDGNTANPIDCGAFSIDTTSGQSQKIGATLQAVFLPVAGSHLFAVYQKVSGGTGFSIQAGPTATMLYEDLRGSANNGTV